MPVFVDEVVINVDVSNRTAAAGAAPAQDSAGEDRQALIAECVERVLEVLRERQEP